MITSTSIYAAPVYPKITWVKDGENVYLSADDAVKLASYLIDVKAYVKKTGGV